MKFILEFKKDKFDKIIEAFKEELNLRISSDQVMVNNLNELLKNDLDAGRNEINNLIRKEFKISNIFLSQLKSEILKHRNKIVNKEQLWKFINYKNQSNLDILNYEIESLLFRKYQYIRKSITRPTKNELDYLIKFSLKELELNKRISTENIIKAINENFNTNWKRQTFEGWCYNYHIDLDRIKNKETL